MLSDLYTPKQLDTFHFAVNNDYFMLINHGRKANREDSSG